MTWNDLRFRALCSKHSTKHVSQVILNINTKNNLGVEIKTSPYTCEALYTVKKKFTILVVFDLPYFGIRLIEMNSRRHLFLFHWFVKYLEAYFKTNCSDVCRIQNSRG